MPVTAFAADRYEKMKYRHCGKSGLVLPEISLGFWQALGEPQNSQLCREVMFAAFDAGITHFDLANNYGPPPGSAEEIVGRHLKAMPRDELVISSKAGFRMWDGPYQDGGTRKYLISSLDQSLKRLQLEYVDIYYHHRFDEHTPMEETLGALDHIVRSGKALYVGISNYTGEQLERACAIIRENNWTPLLMAQPNMSMFVRDREFDLVPVAGREGVGVIPYCPLAGGILTDRYRKGLPEDSRHGRRGEAGREWYEQKKREGVWDKVEKLAQIAERRGQKLAQLALTWLLRDPRVTSVLIGVSRLEQLHDNLKTLDAAPLSEAEVKEIEGVLGG